jgi:hypothetical protein
MQSSAQWVFPAVIDSALKSRESSHPEKEKKPLALVFILFVKGISEKLKHVSNHYNIRTVFRTKHTLRSSLIRTRPERCLLQMVHCICIIPCECGRSYTDETGRPLATDP